MGESRDRLLVLGIGNVLQADEGAGVHVVRRLEGEPLPPGIRCLDGGTGGIHLLGPLQDAARVLLVDAATFDDVPGTVRLLRPRSPGDYPTALVGHDVGLRDLLDAFHVLGSRAELRVLAITIAPHQELGLELSPAVADGAGRACALARREIAAAAP